MYATFKFARRKFREHEAKKAAEAPQQHGVAQSSLPTDEEENSRPGGTKGARNDLAPAPVPSKKPAPKVMSSEDKAEQRRRRMYRLKIVFGLCFPFTLQALDTTIVAAALPTIAAEFNAQAQQNWIISVFNLTAAALLPFWAQAADIFGRHTTIQLTVILMMIGSAICTAAPTTSFPALLVGRALQGVGAAGVNISVRTILADKVSLADYASNWTLFALIGAIGYTIGPVVGGYLTESTWRWCFAINLPVAAIGIVLVVVLLRKELLGPQPLPELEEHTGHTHRARRARVLVRLSTIDFVGQLLFLFGLGLLILALTWAGNGQDGTYPWDSTYVLAPLIVGAVLTALWFAFEFSMAPPRLMSRVFQRQRAMMPWVLFEEKDIGILFIVNFCYGMCMYAVMYFMDYYFQYVQGQSASNAGTALLYFLPGLGVGAYAAMFTANSWPRQTSYPLLLGSICSAVAIQVLCWAIDVGNINVIYGMMALSGFGVGIRMSPSSMHGLAYFPGNTAQITCVFAFALPFGGAVGLTLMSTVYNNELGPAHDQYKIAIMYAYYTIVPFMWLCVIAVLFLGNVWIKKNGDHELVNGAYLWSLITRKKLVRETRHRGGDDWSSAPAHPQMTTGMSGGHRKESNTSEPV